MKKVFLLALAGALFVGCASHPLDKIDKSEFNVQSSLDKDVIQDYKKRRNANDLLEVEIILKSSDVVDIEYKISWIDSYGFVLRSALDERYRYIRVTPDKEVVITAVATDARATNIKIDMKEK
ncbi:putative periplasmic lipoprotein (DUF1425 domain) [Campylobacter iguaniorum]|uniref:DUF1425 domain-containing protein n=1 Tax=Campylobacter iguaniorum TaxID=1244531 RepID=UPI00073A4F6C|nr:DUF1425 domain-containing protein [Campylobacter iguaniorum]ALV23745.1 putative periplasmic lipoprotein (DUF1425 domain) [Campylobacter iguaniorum]